MPGLTAWTELSPGGAIDPRRAVQPSTGGWRTEGRPVVRYDACVNCLLCWLYCPDSAVLLDGEVFSGIDYDYCKGCRLCVAVCPAGALTMEDER